MRDECPIKYERNVLREIKICLERNVSWEMREMFQEIWEKYSKRNKRNVARETYLKSWEMCPMRNEEKYVALCVHFIYIRESEY